jgi:hypothetical protein
MEGDALDELETSARRLADEIGAPLPGTDPGRLLALLSQAHVLTYELEPRRLRSYGPLSEEDAEYLTDRAANLRALTRRLLDEYERGEGEG